MVIFFDFCFRHGWKKKIEGILDLTRKPVYSPVLPSGSYVNDSPMLYYQYYDLRPQL